MKQKTQYVLKSKSDGWFVAPGSRHTSNPASAITLDHADLSEWLKVWGDGYTAIKLADAKEVE